MKLLRFELKKNGRSKQLAVLSLLIFVCVGGLFYWNTLTQDEVINRALKELGPQMEAADTLRFDYNRKVAEVGMTDRIQEGYDNMQAMNQAVRDWHVAITEQDWETIPSIEQRFLQTIIQQNSYGFEYGDFEGDELEQAIEKNRILVELNLPYEDPFISLSSFNFLKQASALFLSPYGLLLLIMLFGDQFTKEWEQHTIRTLHTQPLRKWTILTGKLLSLLMAVGLGLIILIAAALLIPPLFGGKFGSSHYPVLVLHQDGFSYISILQYMGKHLYLFLSVSFFSFSIVYLFSCLLKQRLLATLASLLTILCAFFLTEQLEWLQNPFNPFFYFRFGELIERTGLVGNFAFSFSVIGYGVLLFAAGYLSEVKGLFGSKEQPNLAPFRKGGTLQRPQHKWGMVVFEVRKLKRQKSTKQAVLLIFLSVIGGFFLLHSVSEQKLVKRFDNLEQGKHQVSGYIEKEKERIESYDLTLKQLKEVEDPTSEQQSSLEQAKVMKASSENSIKDFHEHLKENEEEIRAYHEGDWTSYYRLWIDRNLVWAGEIKPLYIDGVVDNIPTERVGIIDFTNKASVAEKELLAERQLPPVLNLEYVLTIHDRFPNPMDRLEWNRRTLKTDSTGLFYSYIFYNSNLYLLLLGILVMLFGVGFSEEKGKKRTLALLATQPLPKNTMYLSKAMTFVAVGFLTALSTLLLIVSAGTIGNRFGDWNFPVLFYDAERVVQSANYTGIVAEEGGFHFINMGRYVVEASVLFLVAILFVLALAFLVSLFVNNTMASLLVSAIILVGGAVLSASSPFASVAHLSPFTYLNVAKIPNGELATLSNNVSITMNVGVWVLLASMVVVIGMGLWRFRRMKLM